MAGSFKIKYNNKMAVKALSYIGVNSDKIEDWQDGENPDVVP